jgi:hypothetical protein
MLTGLQIARLAVLSVVFWVAATLYIGLVPGAFSGSVRGVIAFATTLPVAWLSVLLTRRVGRLAPAQLLSGVALVGALAMMIDGVVLRWLPSVYGSDTEVLRAGAAWLLWGYGVSLAVALGLSATSQSRA